MCKHCTRTHRAEGPVSAVTEVAREVGSKRKAELIQPAVAAPLPKQAKRADVVLVLPKAAEGEVRNPFGLESEDEEAMINLGNFTGDNMAIAQAP
ncbi:hypothetical protein DIPPA_07303 [Diplonema papillatum]|nr:hypothetical protein DIPPA_07303 [Diplonema papillatum]